MMLKMDYSILNQTIQENNQTKINELLTIIQNSTDKDFYLNYVANKFDTPLMSAYKNDDLILFNKLFSLGASFTNKVSQNYTVLDLIIESIFANIEKEGTFHAFFNNFDESDEKFINTILTHLDLNQRYDNFIHAQFLFALAYKNMPNLFKAFIDKITVPQDLFKSVYINPLTEEEKNEDDILFLLLLYSNDFTQTEIFLNKMNSFTKIEEIEYINQAFSEAVLSCNRLDSSALSEQRETLKYLQEYQKIYSERCLLLNLRIEKNNVQAKTIKI
jgi:hypothetical protein